MNPEEKQSLLEQRLDVRDPITVRAFEKIVSALLVNEINQSFKVHPLEVKA